jgi:aconitate decarboxylase
MATQALANWAVSLTTLPEEVTHAALRSFYNWAGCTIGGSTHPATTIARNALSRFVGQPTSTLLGASTQTDAQHAALFNGIASHVHDYDDTHLDTIIHPTGPVASALLAITETLPRAVSGEEFLIALVAGIEAECKVGKAVWPAHYDVGWHITSTTGSIGAAVAVSKILRLGVEETAHAIGLAATQVTGLREMFGSHTKSFHPGRAAQNGLVAAVLAEGGYTSSIQALEAKRGWGNVVGGGHRLGEEIGDLGVLWETTRNAFKPFPCGIVVHPVIDGCVWVSGELGRIGVEIGDVESVLVSVHPLVLELTGKTAPKDGLEAKFSVYHGGAVGLLFGKATPAQYEDEVVVDGKVVQLRDRFRAVADESLRADECHIVVKAAGREAIEKHVDYAVGSLERPMTDEQLTAKFVDQCVGIIGQERTENASRWCWDLLHENDVRQIKDVL